MNAVIPIHTNAPWRGTLTPTEAEVLELLAAGLSNKEIGVELYRCEQTVKFHITNIFIKLAVPNRVRAARWWWEKVERA